LIGENVYVNVTWVCSKNIDKGKCLCKCYMRLFKIYRVGKMFMWMLHEFIWKISEVENVHVNITWVYLKDIRSGKCLCKCYMSLLKWYRQGENVYVNVTWVYLKDIDWVKCLCKCYMSLFKRYQKWKMFM
jgi:hypothetical protein